ncbi:hypothetical protein CAPTEDRAFT_120666 [Capitella teleta]|uniref:Uncharacterized protein n=1 Tax=Capitella teleta TaxID=283909 RepID=R7T8A7_CAPTE|nr:hypothetical protein CAPTEDRAFT_120666 [Capitella teleta]|eukprot:ELT89914.1 hypothetical protein CAPTEDRAFT_120666 [Capitella teleta]
MSPDLLTTVELITIIDNRFIVTDTYVMKLFDRSLDLAQFNEDTPLYPICFEWMRNQPHSRNLGVKSRSTTPDLDDSFDEENTDMPNVYNLPPPLPIKVEGAGRIPSPIPVHDQPLDIYAPHMTAPQPEELLLDHLERWKQTRLK